MHESQVHDLYDYEPQPYLLGFQDEERIKRNGLKKTDFDFKSLIGVSMFGHISMAKHKMSGTFVAIKCLSKKEIMRLKQVDNIYLEKEVLTFLNHPMIIRGGGSFQDASTLYLVTELCPGGDLFTLIARQPSRRLDDGPAKFYAAGVAMALSYLHVRDLIYRALNSENVLIDAKGYIKICDFQQVAGILRRPNKGRNEFTKKRLKRKEFWTVAQHPGPELVQKTQREGLNTTAFEHMRRRFVPHYFAPEVVSLGRHGKETDWWCFGVLVYEMLVGYPPFYDADPPGLFDKICRSYSRLRMPCIVASVNPIRSTAHLLGIETGLSEASKSVPNFPLCSPRSQASEFLFSAGEVGQNLKAQTRPSGAEPEPWMMAM